MTNTQTTKTNSTAKTAKSPVKSAPAKQVTAFLNKREKSGLVISFHETKASRLGDKFAARYVKNLANQISRAESTEKKIVSAASVINDFRQGKFSDDRLGERRIMAYSRQLTKLAGFAVSPADVKRDIMRQSANIWKSGSFK